MPRRRLWWTGRVARSPLRLVALCSTARSEEPLSPEVTSDSLAPGFRATDAGFGVVGRWLVGLLFVLVRHGVKGSCRAREGQRRTLASWAGQAKRPRPVSRSSRMGTTSRRRVLGGGGMFTTSHTAQWLVGRLAQVVGAEPSHVVSPWRSARKPF